jgi:hypothetical protein
MSFRYRTARTHTFILNLLKKHGVKGQPLHDSRETVYMGERVSGL